MIGKNNKKLKELKQGVKVESYSIKKFKFGAASIVIGASIFFGTGVASANEVAASSDSSATNDTNATSGNGNKVPEKINTVSAEKESVASVNKPSSVKEESTKVEVEKKVVDKSLLETSITKLEELLATVNKDKAPASTLSAVNVDLINAKSILENANVSQEEVDALVKKLKQQTQIVSSMPKVTTKEKEVKEGANTIANSGSRDSRNGKSMGEGTQFRAYTATSSSGAMKNVRYFASVDKNTNGGRDTRNDDPEFTERKTVVKSRYEQNSSGRWMVYDVYFNNNGISMIDQSYGQHYYFQPPFNIMDPSNTVRDLTITRYRNVDGNPNRKLSDGGSGFQKVGETVTITDPWHQKDKIFAGDRRSLYDPNSGVSRANQKWYVFKHNQNDSYLDSIVRKTDGNYTGGVSYTLGMEVGWTNASNAIHMTARVKLRDNVTDQQAANGNVYASSVTSGPTTNQAYVVGSRGTSVKAEPDAPKDPIQGLTVTKTVGDALGDPYDPANSGYVRHKYGKPFPPGMTWSWQGDVKPTSTAQAGVFKYTSVATYQDGTKSTDANSGSDGRVTVIVKPKPPIITPNLEHKKGLPNQQITVNVGNGVPNNSKVNIYDGDRIIGTGTTNGQTATVIVKEPLPGKPLKAETVVTNANGTVKSDKSNPVTPTPKPDTQDPTLTFTTPKPIVKVGEKILFNVDGRDDTKVNLDFSDIFTKYPNHLFTQQTNYSVNTDKQKTLSIDLGEAKESDIGEKTVTVKATDDAGHVIPKSVTVKVVPATKENEKHNPTAETLEIGIKQELTDEAIKAKVKNYPSNATLTVKQKPDTDTTGNKTATVVVTYSDKSTDEVTVPVIVRDTTPPKIYWAKDDGSKVELGKTHAEGQNIVIPLYRGDEVNTRLITTDDSGKVTNFKMENLQSGFNFTPVSGTATEGSPLGQNVTGTVGLGVAKGKYTARAISTDGTNSTTGHFVFEVHEQAEKYTPAANTLIVPFNHKITDDEVKGKVIAKPGTPAFPNGTIFEVVSKPETNTTGTDKKAVVKITYPDKSTENIDVPVHVGKDLASQHPLEGHTVTVTVGDSLKTWRGRVDSNQYTNAPKGRGNGVEWGWKGTTPKVVQDTAGVFKYTATATHTDKSVAESNPQVTVIVKPKAPTIETDLTGKAELPNTAVVVNVHEGVKNGSIVTLYSQDGRAIGTGTVTNGKATITGTIPKGNITAKTTVQTPGEQDVTSDPSPEKVATTNKAGIYPIKGKTATVTVGDSLRQWNGRVDANQYTEAGPNGKGIGVEWGWEGTAPKILQDTAGVFKYTATATHTDKTVAKSDPKVTIIVKPKQPTIETDLTGKSNQENVPVTVSVGGGVKDGSIVTLYGPDGTTVIGTGTVTNGKATAIITGKVPVGNITAKTTVQTPGEDNVVSEPSPIKEATNIVPTAKTQTVGLNEQPNAKNSIGNNGDLPNGTNYTWKTTPDTSTSGDKPGVVTVTYPDGSTIDVPVTVKVTQVSDDYTPKYEDGSGKPGTKVEIPLTEENKKDIPDGTTFKSDQPGVITVDDKGKVTVTIPKDKNPGDKITGKITVTYPDGSKDEVPVKVTVTNRDKDDYTPKYEDGSGKPGTKVEIPLTEENKKDIPEKTKFESDTPEIKVDDKGKVTVTIPKDKNPGDKVTGKITVTYPDGSTEEVPVTVTVTNRDKDDYTPKYEDGSGKPGTKVEIPLKEENGKDIPVNTTYVSDQPGVIDVDDKGKVTVTIPKDKNPGDKVTGKITVTYPDGSTEEVPVTVTVTDRDKDVYTPKYDEGKGKPGTEVEIPLTEENKKDIPEKTKFESDTPEIKVDDKGKVTVTIPKDKNPGDKVTGKITVTYPDGSTEEVPVTVTVTNRDKDDYTPKYEDGSGKPGTKVEIPLKEENGKDIPVNTTYVSDQPGVIDVDDKGKVTVTIPKDKNPGDKVTGKITVTYPDGSTEEVPVTVTVTDRDKDVYTPKYDEGKGKPGTEVEIPLTEENKKDIPEKTKFESDTPEIKVDDKGKVTVTIPKDKNPGDKVTGKITVTYPDGSTEEVPVTVTVTNRDKDDYTPKYEDGSGKPGTKVEIPLKEENGKDIPVNTTYVSDQPGVIDVDDKGKVTVTIPKDKNPGDKITGKITVTYPDGSTEEVPVKVTVTPPETPVTEKPGEIEITQQPNGNAIVTPKKPDGSTYPPGTKVEIPGEDGTTITVTIGDNGSGEVPNDNLPKTNVPGTGTVTEPNKKPSQPVDVTTPARKTPTLDVKRVPETGDVIVTPKKPDGSTFPPGTKVEIPGENGPITVTIGENGSGKVPNDNLPKKDVPGTAKITEPGKPAVEVPNVTTPGKFTPETPVTEKPGEIEITQQPNGNAIITPKKPDGSTYPPGTKVEIPGEDGTTITVTIGDNGSGEVPNDNLPKTNVPGTGTVTEPNKKPSQPVDVTTPARKTPTLDVKRVPETGDVIVTPKKPDGSTFPPGTKVEIPGENGPITVTIGENGSGKVPNDNLPKKDVPGTAKITEPGKPAVEVPNVTTPAKVTPETPVTEKPGEIEITQQPNGNAIVTPKKPDGSTYPPGTKVEIPGEDGTTITVTIGDNGSGEVPNDNLPKTNVPGTGTVTEPNKKPSQPVDVTTPARKTPTLDVKRVPETGDVIVTPKKPDGSTFPPGTKVEIPGENGPITVTIGENGSGKVPNDNLPKKDVPGTAKITEPGKPAVEVPNVTTPGKFTPETPVTEKPGEIEITQQPNGNAIITPKKPDGSTYPPGTKVEIPGEDGTTITVTIGDNGSGEVPNDNLPKTNVPGTGTVTEPNKKPSQPVDVTTPARKTPTLDVKRVPETGDVIVTPKKPDGSTFPPGTKVEIPGENGPITVTIGENGSGKVPNDNLPKKDVPGTAKITEPGKPAVEVPNVTTPGKFTPETPVTEKPGEIEITQQPNGNAIITPKKPDGSTYPPGTKVEIPGEDGTTITVTIGDNGSGEVPNDNLPKTNVPGTGTVTEPNKKPSQPVDVTTPARKTPTLDVKRVPETGDVIVTPKKPDGSTFPPGTKVEIPGENGPITVTIGENGSGKVPNDNLPKKDVPGTAKITEPGKPAVEVPNVTTPAKVTPETPVTEKPGEIEITQQPNGNAIVTPKKPDGSTYPSGSKVVIPGENNTPIEVTIGDNGSGEVPNDKLPKKDVPGTGTVTEPNKKPSQPVDVTTPARKTPTIDVERDPKTGDVTVTPKKPDGSTFPPGTKVEIPGENGPITVTIGEDGKGKVPNDNLPKKDVPGTGKITEPGKPTVEVPNVTTPGKFTPETPVTEKPGEIEITRKPNGDAVVTPKKPDGSTYTPGTVVEIPGEDGTTITVTIGDNGSGEVPNDKLPKGNVPGKGTVTEPNKKPSQPVDVTTPARKTPTIDVERDPKTGDVTVTPKKPDGSTYPPGTVVEIPGENGPITVTIGENGKGKVPNDNLPKKEVPGIGKITEPGKPTVEVPNVTTPGKFTPETPVTEKPGEIEITRKPNGDAVVTPKKPDGSTYTPGTVVEIPGEDGTTITVTIGDNGSGEVPNDKLPKGNVPGKGTVTEPNKKPSQPVDVTTPARKTPTLDVEQDPKTGDVTVTPKKPDGSTYPPGTKVEIPGKDGNPIIVTIDKEGKGKVPNSELPEGKVPGTGKITEPGQPTVEVPVITPAKVTSGKVTPDETKKETKRLANTGTTETNTGLAGLGLGILGGLLAAARRRKNDKN